MGIQLTPTAVAEIKRQKESMSMSEAFLRIGVQGGCGGSSFALGLDTESRGDDMVFDFDGLKVAVDQHSLPMVDGRQLDFVSGPMGSGFKFDDLMQRAGGGCGSGGCGCGPKEEAATSSHGGCGCGAGGCGSHGSMAEDEIEAKLAARAAGGCGCGAGGCGSHGSMAEEDIEEKMASRAGGGCGSGGCSH